MPVYSRAVVAPCSRRFRSPSSSRARPTPRRCWSVRTLSSRPRPQCGRDGGWSRGRCRPCPARSRQPSSMPGRRCRRSPGEAISEGNRFRRRIDDRVLQAHHSGWSRSGPSVSGRQFAGRLGKLLQIAQLQLDQAEDASIVGCGQKRRGVLLGGHDVRADHCRPRRSMLFDELTDALFGRSPAGPAPRPPRPRW